MSGDPCPAVKYEWAIRRIDGLEVSSFLDMGGKDESILLYAHESDTVKVLLKIEMKTKQNLYKFYLSENKRTE